MTSIGWAAFYNCTRLTSVTFGENSKLTSIGDSAFSNCTSLASITIPENVTSIGEHAFYDCKSLETITFKGTEEQWNAITKGDGWDSNAGSGTSSHNYNLIFEK